MKTKFKLIINKYMNIETVKTAQTISETKKYNHPFASTHSLNNFLIGSQSEQLFRRWVEEEVTAAQTKITVKINHKPKLK